MSHYVVCSVCGKKFNRDIVQAVKSGVRRYAHYECKPDGELIPLLEKPKSESKKDEDLTKLKNYIKELYGDRANWALINKQLKDFQSEYNYSLSGILKSLIWFYEIKGNNLEKSNGGIGIVPFAYQSARDYYYALWVAQQQNENKII